MPTTAPGEAHCCRPLSSHLLMETNHLPRQARDTQKETHQTHGVRFRSVTSNPNGLPFRLCGLMHAAWPWSGYYQATPQLWVTAHHTHFVKIGWRYLPVGSGTGLLVRTETHTPLSFQSRLFSALRKCHCQDRLETNKNPIRDNNRECLFLP
jgi:hypothetical protein